MEEIAILTELCNDVHIIGGLVDIMQLDNILMEDHLHDVNLWLDILEIVRIYEEFLIDHFDRHDVPSF